MKKRNIIHRNNSRIQSPLLVIMITYLLFDKWHVYEWIYGIFGLLYFMWLIVFIVDFFNATEVDIFDKSKKE